MQKFSFCFISSFLFISISLIFFFFSLYFLYFDLIYFVEWELISLQSSVILMTFLFDWMTFMFMFFVLFISSLVIFFSEDYMKGEKNSLNRFIYLIILFIFSMMMLIISPNLISILLGWDGLGLVSYCLVIYYQNIKSYNAGMLTALSNRVGDVALLMAIVWMMNYGSWNFIFYIELMKQDFFMSIIAFFVSVAAMTKSAQLPFSSWLPAAMAAPTPVSALVHSSTLVTAGIYLLIRFNILLIDTIFSKVLLLIGSLTMFMAGLSANFEYDLKKIIALSTLSQLGLMMSILSLGFSKLAFFHLLTHALFKALLFMCAGVIIHNMKNSQDIRDMGALGIFMPFTISCFNISNLALCGMPFLAGFYSKDLILEMVLISPVNFLSFFLFFFSTGLTVCYSFRLIFYSISGGFNEVSLNSLNDESLIMSFSLVNLTIFAMIGGSFLNWLIFSSFYMVCLTFFMKVLVLLICFLGGGAGYLLSNVKFNFLNKSLNFFYFFSYLNSFMWFMPFLSTMGVMFYPLVMGKVSSKVIDQGWSEYFGGLKIFLFMKKFSLINQFLQNNNLKVYLMLFVVWFIFLIFLMFFV